MSAYAVQNAVNWLAEICNFFASRLLSDRRVVDFLPCSAMLQAESPAIALTSVRSASVSSAIGENVREIPTTGTPVTPGSHSVCTCQERPYSSARSKYLTGPTEPPLAATAMACITLAWSRGSIHCDGRVPTYFAGSSICSRVQHHRILPLAAWKVTVCVIPSVNRTSLSSASCIVRRFKFHPVLNGAVAITERLSGFSV